MKDFEIICRDWADRENVLLEYYYEDSYHVELHVSNIELNDLIKLNRLSEEWEVKFINPLCENLIRIYLNPRLD